MVYLKSTLRVSFAWLLFNLVKCFIFSFGFCPSRCVVFSPVSGLHGVFLLYNWFYRWEYDQ